MTTIPLRFYCYEIHFMASLYYHPIYAHVFQVPAFPRVSPAKNLYSSLLSTKSVTCRPLISSPPNIWWGVQIIKLSVIQSSPLPLFPRHAQSKLSSSAPYSLTPSANYPPSMWEVAKFDVRIWYLHGLRPAQLRKRATN